MNELITPLSIDKPINKGEFRIFCKGIWTGLLIALIFHHMITIMIIYV